MNGLLQVFDLFAESPDVGPDKMQKDHEGLQGVRLILNIVPLSKIDNCIVNVSVPGVVQIEFQNYFFHLRHLSSP